MKSPALPILLLFLLLPSLCHALTGKVIIVADGDTITILDSSKQQHKTRLYCIDCPEKCLTLWQGCKEAHKSPNVQEDGNGN